MKETNVEKFDREIGLDQESAASWRKRWEAELADEREPAPAPDELRDAWINESTSFPGQESPEEPDNAAAGDSTDSEHD